MTLILNGTTGISGVDGSSGTPAFKGNDSNTGISFGTDIVTINTGGTARVTTDASGNVGIGTISATSKFFVTTASSTLYGLISQTPVVGLTAGNYVNMAYFSDSRGGTNDGLRIVNVRDSTGSGVGDWETSSYRIRRSVDQNDAATGIQEEIVFGNSLLAFNTGGSERMRITSSGNVGIGTSSPAAGYRLDAAGAAIIGATGTNAKLGLKRSSDGVEQAAISVDGTSLLYNNGTGGHIWQQAGTERMRIDSSGNVGIGTSSPQNRLMIQDTNAGAAVAGIRVINGDATNFHRIDIGYNSGSATGYVPANAVYIDGFKGGGFGNLGALAIGTSTDAPLVFGTNSTERMRIDSSGNLLVGTTTLPSNGGTLHCGGTITSATGYRVKPGQSGALGGNLFNIDWTGSPQLWIDTTNLGTITVVSDYRIKKNVATQTTSALDRVMQLRPVNYEIADYGTLFKADGVVREGFIAHELAEIIPSAVSGEKDTENQIQSLKLDALCSVLTKAIQEQQALITQLQADVAALKGAA